MPASAAKLGDANRGIGLETAQRVRELVVHRPGHGVARARPVERDARGHAVLLVIHPAGVAHAPLHGERFAAIAPRTSAVCSPSSGGDCLTLAGVSLSFTGMPSVRTGPSTG